MSTQNNPPKGCVQTECGGRAIMKRGSSKSSPAPESSKRRTARPDPPDVPDLSELSVNKPEDLCLVHAHEVHRAEGPRTPYATAFYKRITQREARQLFTDGSPLASSPPDPPLQAQTRRGVKDGRPIIVKKFGASRETVSAQKALEWAKTEVSAHVQLWRNVAPEARRFFAAPACMEFDPCEFEIAPRRRPYAYPYTVQAMIDCGNAERELQSAWDFFTTEINKREDSNFHRMPLAEVRKLCEQYGEVLAVMHRAGIVHNDLHQDNVLVCHNGNSATTSWSVPWSVDQPHGLYIQFKVIDFGLAQLHPHGNAPNPPIQPCLYKESEAQRIHRRVDVTLEELRGPGRAVVRDGFSVKCAGEYENVLELLRAAFFSDGVPKQEDIVRFVREGYLLQLDKPWEEWAGTDEALLARLGF
jgi:hypothetical protein